MRKEFSREDAINLLDNLIGMVEDNHNSDYDTALKMAIKALEQEPRKGQWIDIHDRLPEGKTFDSFLVCYENGAVVTEQLWCICDSDYNEHIVAWMPLPKPYRGKR